MKTPDKEERRFGRWFVEESTGNEIKDIVAHVKEKHGIDLKTTKVQQKMDHHIDGSDFYAGADSFEVGGATYQIFYCYKRKGMNAHIWADRGE